MTELTDWLTKRRSSHTDIDNNVDNDGHTIAGRVTSQ